MAGAAFAVELDGTVAGDEYDKLNAAGTVSLGNASLQASVGFVTMTGDEFIIIDNDLGDAISGTFAGLAQGAELQIGNRFFAIDYAAGDGNDVSLTTHGAVIDGNSAANVINGTSSVGSQPFATNFRDLINGNGGDDQISGLDGNDTLTGAKGNDTLNGGAGDDMLNGGLGRDNLFGGTDADRFDYNSIKDSVTGSQRDKIQDFKRGQGDKIDLRDIDAKTSSGKFIWIGKDKFSDKKGQLRYEDNGATSIVQGDVNGDGKADFEIFVNISSLAKGDFLL
jgi:Ca2+-binding RTX toxin-like protein